MSSVARDTGLGQWCVDTIADITQAQRRLYTPDVQRVLDTPGARNHERAIDPLTHEQAVAAATAEMRAHLYDLTGDSLDFREARSIVVLTIAKYVSALVDGGTR